MAKNSYGIELWACVDGGVLAKVPGLLECTPPKITREMIDATAHDSGDAEELIPGGYYRVDPIPFQMHYIAGSTFDDLFAAGAKSAGLHDFKIVVKAATGTEDITFSGYISDYGPDSLPVNGKQTASGVIRATGAISQAA